MVRLTPAARLELTDRALAMARLLEQAPRSSVDAVELSGETVERLTALLGALAIAACDRPDGGPVEAAPASEQRPADPGARALALVDLPRLLAQLWAAQRYLADTCPKAGPERAMNDSVCRGLIEAITAAQGVLTGLDSGRVDPRSTGLQSGGLVAGLARLERPAGLEAGYADAVAGAEVAAAREDGEREEQERWRAHCECLVDTLTNEGRSAGRDGGLAVLAQLLNTRGRAKVRR